MENVEKKSTGLGTASLVLGIISIVFSLIPLLNVLCYILGSLSFIFGLIVVFKKDVKKGGAITGIVLGILSIVIMYSMYAAAGAALNKASEEIQKNNEELNVQLDKANKQIQEGLDKLDKINN